MEYEVATGTRLDKIGALQGVDRGGRSDEEYRASILSEMSKREDEAGKEFMKSKYGENDGLV